VVGSTPAPGVVFRALAENPDAPKRFKRSCQHRPRSAGREGAACHARGRACSPALHGIPACPKPVELKYRGSDWRSYFDTGAVIAGAGAALAASWPSLPL